MRIGYLECFSGVSGNMMLGALIDAGLPAEILIAEMGRLPLKGYKIKVNKVEKCGVAATHVDVDVSRWQRHRNLNDILKIIDESALKPEVKEMASKVFRRLGYAEAKVHGTSIDKVHFHEVGAVDAIIDIVGTCFGLHHLGITKLYSSPLRAGKGFVKAAHGIMPIPAPATTELLVGVPWYNGEIARELVTPTGAAIVKELCDGFGDRPDRFVSELAGYGAGTWDLDIPNVVRLSIGSFASESAEIAGSVKWVGEANIDDGNPEFLPYVIERLLAQGALDAWITPIVMKKGRSAHMLSVLVEAVNRDEVAQLILAETSTFGIRWHSVNRTEASRSWVLVQVPWGEVRVKIGEWQGKTTQVSPEYEDCRRLATGNGVPLKTVYQAALRAYYLERDNNGNV